MRGEVKATRSEADAEAAGSGGRRGGSGTDKVVPPRKAKWWTPEYIIYYLIHVVFYWNVVRGALDLSDRADANHRLPRLRSSYHPTRKVDMSDYQWAAFRENAPILVAALGGLVLASRLLRAMTTRQWPAGSGTPASGGRRGEMSRTAFNIQIGFYLMYAGVFYWILHGSGALLMAATLATSFALGRLARATGLPYAVATVTWGFAAVVLYTNEYYSKLPYAHFVPALGWMDGHKGMIGHISFNLLVLRMISFNMDWHWAASEAETRPGPGAAAPDNSRRSKHLAVCEICSSTNQLCYEERVKAARPLSDYSLVNFVAYATYAPLYLAGPTTTFNAWVSHVRAPQVSHSRRDVAVYALRLGLAVALMEALTHYMHMWAINKAKIWRQFSPYEICLLGYWTLNIMWLKFLIIWRSFRLVALADGVEVPENMNRCVNNNYTLTGFWKQWHRSFNRWLVRYLYIPTGGSKYKYYNVWVVFTFVALWHDMTFNLLAWAWLICLFLMPEIAVLWFFRRPSMRWFREKWYYNYLCGWPASINIILMMLANLVGFSVGFDGVAEFLRIMNSAEGYAVLGVTVASFWVGAQVMFEVRAVEAEKSARGKQPKGF